MILAPGGWLQVHPKLARTLPRLAFPRPRLTDQQVLVRREPGRCGPNFTAQNAQFLCRGPRILMGRPHASQVLLVPTIGFNAAQSVPNW